MTSRHVIHHVGHRNVVSALCEVTETPTEWKSESMTTTDGINSPSPRDASTSKNGLVLGDFGQTVKLTITVLVHPLPIMVDAHVVSELVRHDQSTATHASRLGYCAGCLSF